MKKPFYGWWIVLAAAICLALSPGPVVFYSLGVFMQALIDEFSWTRADVAFAATVTTVAIIISMPLVGFIIDRVGPRRVLLFSVIAMAVGLSLLYFIRTLSQFYLIYGFIGIGGAGANSAAYMKILSSWFNRNRGLAIGIASAGMGFGFTIVPGLTQWAINMFEFRGAYLTLALIVILVNIPLVFLVLRESPSTMGLLPDGEQGADTTTLEASAHVHNGFTLGEAVRTRQFWILILVFFPVGGAIYALAVHLVSIVTGITGSTSTAIQAATLLGVAMMTGRVMSGYLFDRFFAPIVVGVIFFMTALGVWSLTLDSVYLWIFPAAMLIGFCSGTEGDALAYLVSRYFGIQAFGRIYGYMFSAVMLGVSFFPYLIALDYDNTGNYQRGLLFCFSALLIGAMLLMLIGPYPEFRNKNFSGSDVQVSAQG